MLHLWPLNRRLEFPQGGKGQEEVAPRLAPGGLQEGAHQLLGGAGLGGGLEDHQAARGHMGGEGGAGRLDVGEVRSLPLREGGGDADDQGVGAVAGHPDDAEDSPRALDVVRSQERRTSPPAQAVA